MYVFSSLFFFLKYFCGRVGCKLFFNFFSNLILCLNIWFWCFFLIYLCFYHSLNGGRVQSSLLFLEEHRLEVCSLDTTSWSRYIPSGPSSHPGRKPPASLCFQSSNTKLHCWTLSPLEESVTLRFSSIACSKTLADMWAAISRISTFLGKVAFILRSSSFINSTNACNPRIH